MQLVKQAEIAAVHSVVINGIEHPIGTVRRFSGSDTVERFLPSGNPTAMSWVQLERGEEIAAHRHAEPGMVIVTQGTGEMFGDREGPLVPGDMVLVSAGALHGFRAVGEGFQGISVQFSGTTIYEDTVNPKVVFESDPAHPFGRFLDRHAACLSAYAGSDLMQLLDDDAIRDSRVQEALLDCLQAWSDDFQLLLHLRVALTVGEEHRHVAVEHLKEEMGHNDNLRAQRGATGRTSWDAAMQAAMTWFRQAILHGTDLERALLVHLVLESSGEVFHASAARIFGDMDHFRQHGEDDGLHAQYGIDLLKKASPQQLEGLVATLDSGWAMMTLLCDRMAHLARVAGAT